MSIQPRAIPKEGVRKLSARPEPQRAPALLIAAVEPAAATTDAPLAEPVATPLAPVVAARPTLRPVADDKYSLTVHVDAAFKAELDELKALLSHKVPNGNLTAVLREAVRCAIETHGKRKGTVEPKRKAPKKARDPQPSSRTRDNARAAIAAEVKRQVYKRDGGCCTFVGPDGKRCGSRWKLEFHHLQEVALGGPSTLENITLRCRGHNVLAAEATFGRARMEQFRRREEEPRTGEVTDSGKVLPSCTPAAKPSPSAGCDVVTGGRARSPARELPPGPRAG